MENQDASKKAKKSIAVGFAAAIILADYFGEEATGKMATLIYGAGAWYAALYIACHFLDKKNAKEEVTEPEPVKEEKPAKKEVN